MPIERIACSVFALVCLALGVFAFIVTEQRDLARQDAVTWEESAKRNRAALEDMTAAHAKLQESLEEREGKLAALEQDRERQRVKLREAMRNDSRLAIGAALCCLLPLTGCSGKPMATMPVIIRQDAPAYLTAETPTPLWDGVTNADLLGYALDLRQALGACNADKAAIRAATGKE